MENFTCEICGAPMKLEKKLSTVKKVCTMYRRRRFHCTVCDFSETIYGDGSGDKKTRPNQAIEDVKKMFKQEETNRT